MIYRFCDRASLSLGVFVLLSLYNIFQLPVQAQPGLDVALNVNTDRYSILYSWQDTELDSIRVAVLDLDALDIPITQARSITERLRLYLGEYSHIIVLERNKMEEVLTEVGFQLSGACNTEECIVQVGKILGVSKMIAGSVSVVGNLYSLQVRIIDISTSQIEKQAFVDVDGIERVLTEATQQVVEQLVGRVSPVGKSPILASSLSLLIPGVGQYYSGRSSMGTLYLLLIGAGGIYTTLRYQKYNELMDDYDALTESYLMTTSFTEMQQLEQEMEIAYSDIQDRKDQLKILAIALPAAWLINVFDAYIFTPRGGRVNRFKRPAYLNACVRGRTMYVRLIKVY